MSSPTEVPQTALTTFLRSNFRDKKINSIIEDRLRSSSRCRHGTFGENQSPRGRLQRSSSSYNGLSSKAIGRWGCASQESPQNDSFRDRGLKLPSRRSSLDEIASFPAMYTELKRSCSDSQCEYDS